MTYRPVIILGAPRTGTNMLRDVLTSLPGFATWPCDEINALWKHGNISRTTDDLRSDDVRSGGARFMDRRFADIARRYDADHVVEKTCANCLRVPYVHALVPEARYLLLLRDGLDAVASTLRRWRRPVPGGRYYLDKLRFVAPTDVPRVVFDALRKRLHGQFAGASGRWTTWGPVFPELIRALESGASLDEVCALQWSRCTLAAIEGLRVVPDDCRLVVGYEAFVSAPQAQLGRIVRYLDGAFDDATLAAAVADVSTASVGKATGWFDAEALARIEPLIAEADEWARRLKEATDS